MDHTEMLRRIAEHVEQLEEHEATKDADIRSFVLIATYRQGDNREHCGIFNINSNDPEGEADHMQVAQRIMMNTSPQNGPTLVRYLCAPIRRLLHISFHALSAEAIASVEHMEQPNPLNVIKQSMN